MGKRKIEIKKIEDKQSRAVTFSKRRDGLFKKASKFADLFNLDLALVVVSSAGNLFECGNTRVVMDRNLHHHQQPQPSTSDESVSSYRLLLDTDISKMSVPELEQHLRDLDAMESELPIKEVEIIDEKLPTDLSIEELIATYDFGDEVVYSDCGNFSEEIFNAFSFGEHLLVADNDNSVLSEFPFDFGDDVITANSDCVVFSEENSPAFNIGEDLLASHNGNSIFSESELMAGNTDYAYADQDLMVDFRFEDDPRSVL